MRYRGYFYVGFATTLNIILYALTLGTYHFLEGRVSGGIFHNWGLRFRFRPRRFVKPTTEEQLVELIKSSRGIRFFGAGHSFNEGVVADEVLVSLDDYTGVVRKDLPNKRVTFRGGTRVRECVRLLLEDGLAFSSLPSHNAQSIAGIISTDVHGTGRDWGFVSQLVVSIKLIDGQGNIHRCVPEDDLFRAAIGGIGAVGVISEVEVQAVARFNIDQRVEMTTRAELNVKLTRLMQENEHFSLYLYPFTEICQINTWNSSPMPQSTLGPLREFLNISADALLSAWFGGFMAYTGLLPKWSRFAYGFKRSTDLVLESDEGYSRTIYHLHEELEFTVAYEDNLDMCYRFIDLYEKMYTSAFPYTLFEIRFTPSGHERTLIGPGRDRRSMWIDIVCNDSHGFETYYAAVEELTKTMDARPHPGKYNKTFTKADLKRLYPGHFEKFIGLVAQHDPAKKFANNFTRRLFRD